MVEPLPSKQTVASSNLVSRSKWPRGGIGRHDWFRPSCRKVWGFESLRGYHNFSIQMDTSVRASGGTGIRARLRAVSSGEGSNPSLRTNGRFV
jgi:hypothetical protein